MNFGIEENEDNDHNNGNDNGGDTQNIEGSENNEDNSSETKVLTRSTGPSATYTILADSFPRVIRNGSDMKEYNQWQNALLQAINDGLISEFEQLRLKRLRAVFLIDESKDNEISGKGKSLNKIIKNKNGKILIVF